MGNNLSARREPWLFWSGPIAGVLLFAVVFLFSTYVAVIPNPGAVLLVAVAYGAFVGGWRCGLLTVAVVAIACALAVLYAPIAAAIPQAATRIPIGTASGVVLVGIIATLRKWLEDAQARKLGLERTLFEATIENLHDAVLECDFAGIRHVNASFCRMTGFTRDELIGVRPPFPFWPAEEYARIAAALETAMRGKALDFELVLSRKDGRRFPVLLSVSRFADETANARVIYTFRDITERRNAEEAIRTSEARLRALLNVAQLGTWDWDLGSDMVTGSEKLRELFGLPPGVGDTPISDYFPMIHPDDVARVRAAVHASINQHVPYHIEFRIRHADGRVTWLAAHGGAILDDTGKAVRLLGATMDITDRRAAEEALRAHHQTLRRLAGANIIGVLIASLDGIHEANDAFLAMTGYSADDIHSRRITWRSITPEEYLPQDAVAVEELRTTGVCKPFDKEYIRKDGSRVRVTVVAMEMSAEPQRWLCLVANQPRRNG